MKTGEEGAVSDRQLDVAFAWWVDGAPRGESSDGAYVQADGTCCTGWWVDRWGSNESTSAALGGGNRSSGRVSRGALRQELSGCWQLGFCQPQRCTEGEGTRLTPDPTRVKACNRRNHWFCVLCVRVARETGHPVQPPHPVSMPCAEIVQFGTEIGLNAVFSN